MRVVLLLAFVMISASGCGVNPSEKIAEEEHVAEAASALCGSQSYIGYGEGDVFCDKIAAQASCYAAAIADVQSQDCCTWGAPVFHTPTLLREGGCLTWQYTCHLGGYYCGDPQP